MSMDYAFRQWLEYDDGGVIPCAVMSDRNEGCTWGHPGGQTGELGWAGIVAGGHCAGTCYGGTKVGLKPDQSEALAGFKNGDVIARKAATVHVVSPARASKGTGRVELAIQSWQFTVRVLKA